MRQLIFTLLGFVALSLAAREIDLSGEWDFAVGERPVYNDKVTLPGSMLTNGKGDDVTLTTQWVSSLYDSSYYFNPKMEKYRQPGNMKFPFFLTPDKHYVGNAWYRRNVRVPSDWKKGRVLLHLERPHIETEIWVNGRNAGRDSSLSVPHRFDITPYVKPGADNEIAIRVYNGIENVCVGQDSHSVTDQTQGDWNGVVGRMALEHRPDAYIDDVAVFPSAADKNVRVDVRLAGDTAGSHSLAISCRDKDGEVVSRKVKFKGAETSVTLPMGDDVKLWDEFAPNLYFLAVRLDGRDERTVTFGVRDFAIDGKMFTINGRPALIRGTVGNCCFPLTGYPPTDEESWLAIFNKCKEYGLNMMRFHSYCPPEAAFSAADKVGFYLQPEGPSWPNHGVKLGKGMSIDRYLLEETERMVKEYGNHPSFCMLAAGNEPAGDWVRWVGDFVDYWKSTGDIRRVYCGASVGGGWAWDPKSQYHVKGGARGLDWNKRTPQSVDDYSAAVTQFTQKGSKPVTFDIHEPYLSHEQGQWCAFPDFKEINQYTGAYKAANFEIFRELLADNGMASRAGDFLKASGKLQTLAYKYEIERNLRTPDYAGFQLLSLNDYSGQGTALVGVLNVFWKEKGYCTAEDWGEFCAPVVPLARIPKFVYSSDDAPVEIPVEMYNAFSDTLRNVSARYQLTIGDSVVYTSEMACGDIPVGKNNMLKPLLFSPDMVSSGSPEKLHLSVALDSENAPRASNSWDLWVYPAIDVAEAPSDIYVTDSLDSEARGVLARGGKVLLTAAGKVRFGSDVKQTYLPVFWNTSWFKMRPPHTTGASIDREHPLFRGFPTDEWANLNWWELLNNAQVMNLRHFPAEYQPPVQPIDTWHVSRKLGMLVEANVLGGKLLMTTMDIDSDLDRRIVARQMRKAILDYMDSDLFAPEISLDEQVIADLFIRDAEPVDMFTRESPDELKPKLK